MIKAIIIDDESKGIEILRILLKNHCPEVNVIGFAEEVTEAINLVNKLQPDLIFLDIEMADGTGFDLLVKVKPYSFHVIFVTAHSEYAVRAFRYSVSDYLLKPVDSSDLVEAVQKVKLMIDEVQHKILNSEKQNDVNQTLKIPVNHGSVFIKINDIIRIEADGSYTRIYLSGSRNFVISYNIKVVEEHLNTKQFIRVHRSNIINLCKVKMVSGQGAYVVMCDDAIIKISRRIRTNFISQMAARS